MKSSFVNTCISMTFFASLGGCATYSPVDISTVTDSAENSTYAAVRVYRPGEVPSGDYEKLGKVDSYICNRSGTTPATPEAATDLIRDKARRAGATAVINYECKQSGTSFDENCWGSIKCSGYAIRSAGGGGYPPNAQESQPKATGKQIGLGTCFAVSPNGYLVTNNHVIKGASQIYVRMSSGTVLPATVVADAPSTDLAILKVDARNIKYLSLSSSKNVRLGDEVFTIGYPLAHVLGTDPKYTNGVISAKSGLGGEAIAFQITVPIQPGNSGGPLVNTNGQVVGIITSTASSIAFLKGSGNLPQNINWAVKSDYATLLMDDIPKNVQINGRQEAIRNTKESICMVLTTH